MKRVYVLLGGVGPGGKDGYVTSSGLWTFTRTLAKLPDTVVATYTWGNYEEVSQAIGPPPHSSKIVVIGYSGGGSRATWIANMGAKSFRRQIDLMVLWDPSPSWQMETIPENVKKVLVFHNLNPMMPSLVGWLGGGDVTLAAGNKITEVTRVNISEQHLLVQADPSIKDKTLKAVAAI